MVKAVRDGKVTRKSGIHTHGKAKIFVTGMNYFAGEINSNIKKWSTNGWAALSLAVRRTGGINAPPPPQGTVWEESVYLGRCVNHFQQKRKRGISNFGLPVFFLQKQTSGCGSYLLEAKRPPPPEGW